MKLSERTVENLLKIMSQRTERPNDEWTLVADYGEPGYSKTIQADEPDTSMVVLGYYWCRDKNDTEDNPNGRLYGIDDIYGRVWRQMEAQGVCFEWSDEWVVDDGYNRAYRSGADSYFWTPSYVWTEDGIITIHDDPEYIIDWARNDHNRALTEPFVKIAMPVLEEFGFWKVNEYPYENGFHRGMDSDPKAIIRALEQANGPTTDGTMPDYIFVLVEKSQFYIKFDLYIREDRNCLASGHYGHDGQVEVAVDSLTDDEMALFTDAFPEYETWRKDHYTDAVDPEYSSWVADWIELNTNMYWDDGDLWERLTAIIPDSIINN